MFPLKFISETFLAELQLGRALPCVRECVCEAAWTRPAQLHTLIVVRQCFLSHTLRLPPLRLSPASCSHHRRAGADSPSSRHWEPAARGRRSPQSGDRMKFWGPCSVGFYICVAMLFKGRLWVKFFSFKALLSIIAWTDLDKYTVRNWLFWLENKGFSMCFWRYYGL